VEEDDDVIGGMLLIQRNDTSGGDVDDDADDVAYRYRVVLCTRNSCPRLQDNEAIRCRFFIMDQLWCFKFFCVPLVDWLHCRWLHSNTVAS